MSNRLATLSVKVQRRWREYYARLLNLAVESKLVPATGDYTKFIILTRSRSGSNYLVDLLNSHENIVCFNELFSRSGQTLWGLPGYRNQMAKSSAATRLKHSDPVQFMTQYIHKNYPRHISAVGFKLLYNQAHKGVAENLWTYLSELDEVRIIHLKRKNLLKVLVSKKLATENGVWVKREHEPDQTTQQTIALSREECMELFTWTREQQAKYEDVFKSKPVMDLVYEDLLADTENVMNDVQGFLGVDKQVLTAGTRKQSTRALSETVSNYEELKDHFAGTEWEAYFK